MARGRGPKAKKAPSGAWLAFLAIAVQVLLPFLVVYEIALASNPAYAETTTICLAPGSSGAPSQHHGQSSHHGLADGCPICTALAAGQAFTAATATPLPLPRAALVVVLRAPSTARLAVVAAASYSPRAPPFPT